MWHWDKDGLLIDSNWNGLNHNPCTVKRRLDYPKKAGLIKDCVMYLNFSNVALNYFRHWDLNNFDIFKCPWKAFFFLPIFNTVVFLNNLICSFRPAYSLIILFCYLFLYFKGVQNITKFFVIFLSKTARDQWGVESASKQHDVSRTQHCYWIRVSF